MKLSIITINLNNAAGLKQTIESALSQSFTDFEFLIIDGGSRDESVDIIKTNEDRITYWISEPDKGIYNAMNKAITKAEGEYCYFLNSGDYFANKFVLQEVFRDDSHESFVCGNFITDKKGVQQKFIDYKNRDWSFSLYDIFSGFVAHQAFFIKREMFEKYGLYDERLRIMSDWKLFFIAIGINQEVVKYRDVDIVVYDMDGISSHIGGKVINEEKLLVAKEELHLSVFEKINRLSHLESNGYIVDFVQSKKWINFIFRVFLKFCKELRLTKI